MCKRSDIIELQHHAISRDGILLSTKYINNNTKMEWQCSEGHVFSAKWSNIKNNGWCPQCSKNKSKLDIIEIQKFAASRNGILLSQTYNNNHEKLEWQCSMGHKWKAKCGDIKNKNAWCPTCAGLSKPDISELHQHAIGKGGKLLSDKYLNSRKKLLWECSEGHNWEASWGNIYNSNTWCPKCSSKKYNILLLQQHAKLKNGVLLSNEYENKTTHLLWKCNSGHQWEASWENINKGTWCPECASFKTEYRCKQLLEAKFGFEFKKTRFYYNKYK